MARLADLVRRQPRLWVAISVFGLCLAVYVLTLAPGVLGGDSGEFQYIPYILGVAHPTGYPLYTLLGWLWAHGVVVGDVAYRMNLLSAVLGASTAALLYLIVHHLTLRHAPALLAAVLFAFSPTFWMQAIVAEVYTLHTAFVVLVIYLLLMWEAARPSAKYLLLAAFVYGLSLTHHRVIIIFLPALALFVWLTDRKVFTHARLLLKMAVFGFSPLLLYLYAPLRIRQLYPPIFHDQILDNLLGTSFGVEFEWPTVAVVGKFLVLLARQYGWVTILGVWGLVVSFVTLPRGDQDELPRRCLPCAVMLLVAGLCNALFGLFYQAFDVEVFLLPFYLLFALWLGLGWQWSCSCPLWPGPSGTATINWP
jgi:4-amino-4-deoxy-L-arabinose transferase-like glycosyltransferase